MDVRRDGGSEVRLSARPALLVKVFHAFWLPVGIQFSLWAGSARLYHPPMISRKSARAVAVSLVALFTAASAAATETDVQAASCGTGNVLNGPLLHFAAAAPQPVPWGGVRITYAGHSSFLIETPGGASVFTDFSGIHKPPYVPDVVTINNANTAYAADYMESRIAHVLRGWDPDGGVAQHNVKLKDLHVFSLPTNVLDLPGGSVNGNSIFVMEAGGLCIAHLGNIQHILRDEERRALQGVDVLMVPIDGDVNLSHAEVMMIIDQVDPRLVIPMHLQLPGPAKAFRSLTERFYSVRDRKGPLVVRAAELPETTQVLFMEP